MLTAWCVGLVAIILMIAIPVFVVSICRRVEDYNRRRCEERLIPRAIARVVA